MASIGQVSNAYREGAAKRPEFCEDEHLEYLDELRESDATNMFCARPYLMGAFPDLLDTQAAKILGYWAKSFRDRHKERIEAAEAVTEARREAEAAAWRAARDLPEGA